MSTPKRHPYAGRPKREFWKSAISTVPRTQIADLATPKNKVGPEDVVGTAGSCFAQHIARNLRERGFRFLDVEPPPQDLRPERYGAFGYGMYSARYANIYTASQLRQLIERAYKRFSPAEPAWTKGTRFYDPFRPNIEPEGYESEAEMLKHRDYHLGKVAALFRSIDVFVFTLGLTEGWRAKADGSTFPIAPGVQGIGEYDPDKYEFVNFNYSAINADMRAAFSLLRRVNPNIRVLLTVSPVPLAATASGEHVLTATTYSKSVLRAVAGDLAQDFDFVDYFPSYELITAPVFEGRAYQDDWREVRPEAVSGVMDHFFASFISGLPPKKRVQTSRKKDKDDVVCEESILANYAHS